MSGCKVFFAAILVIVSFSFISAQTLPVPDSEKDKKADAETDKKKKDLEEKIQRIVDAAVADNVSLKLPENRAVVYGISGDIYWKFDEKRARELFRAAAGEIITFNQEAEKARKDSTDPYSDMFDTVDVRTQILPMVARRDAEMALELLLQTRPARLTDAIQRAAQPNAKSGVEYLNFDPQNYRVQQEVALEQQFALLAAEDNPEKAIKLIKDSLSKGISWNVLPLLQKLNKKDEKKAGELAGDIIKKLTDTDLTRKAEDLGAAVNFLQYAVKPDPTAVPKEKPFKFSDSQIKDLANKLADTFLQPSKELGMTMMLSQTMSLLEKILPERAALLRQRESEGQNNIPTEIKNMQMQQKLWDPNSTPEEILAQLPKITNEMNKVSAYQSLSNKISQIEDEARAKKLIDQIPDEKAKANAQELFESARINRTAASGKLEDARKQISNLTKKGIQIKKLVALATQFYKKGGEKDIETAKGLMKDARLLANESPDSEDDYDDLLEVVKGYATVDQEVGFKLFDPIVDQLNEYVQAAAVLSKFNARGRTFKKGELILKATGQTWDGVVLFRYMPQIQMLGKADLERMNVLSDRFTRPDARTIVKLYIVQGFMKDDKKTEEPMPIGNTMIFN